MNRLEEVYNKVNKGLDPLIGNRVEDIKFLVVEDHHYNGTGYLNGLMEYNMPIGHMGIGKDKHDRVVIAIGTRFGCVVIFQRYEGSDIVVGNIPTPISKLYPGLLGSQIDTKVVDMLLGFAGIGNIGDTIESFINHYSII